MIKFLSFILCAIFLISVAQAFSVTGSIIENTTDAGLYLYEAMSTEGNYFYNNLFNNTINYYEDTSDLVNYFNTTLVLGTNVVGGLYIGGNYWDNYTAPGTGFSATCTDNNENGICDSFYSIDGATSAIDYLPLTNYVPDTTEPAVTINSPTNTTYSTATVTLNVTATDERDLSSCLYTLDSGTTNVSLTNTVGDYYTASHASLSNQLYTAQFYCNDTSNNVNNTESVSFTISVVAAGDDDTNGGGSSSSSSSTTTPTESDETQSFTTVNVGEPTEMVIDNEGIFIKRIIITTTETVSGGSVTITVTDVLPQPNLGIGLPSGISYQTLKINVSGFGDTNLDSVIIEFEVNKNWMEEQMGTADRIVLFRRQDTATQWEPLITIVSSEDIDSYYFNATSPGFSEFTIFLLSGQNCVNPGESRCNGDLVQLCLANYEWRNIKQCANGCFEGECINPGLVSQVKDFFSNIFSQQGFLVLSAVIIIISFGVVVVVYILVEKRKGSRGKKR